MTGFDETVPPDDTSPDEDGTAAGNARDNVVEPTPADTSGQVAAGPADVGAGRPEHDSAAPAFEDDPQPDEPGDA